MEKYFSYAILFLMVAVNANAQDLAFKPNAFKGNLVELKNFNGNSLDYGRQEISFKRFSRNETEYLDSVKRIQFSAIKGKIQAVEKSDKKQ